MTKGPPFRRTRELIGYLEGRTLFPATKLIGRGASSASVKFIFSLMRPRPEQRLTAKEALKDPWLIIKEEEKTCSTQAPNAIVSKDSNLSKDTVLPNSQFNP